MRVPEAREESAHRQGEAGAAAAAGWSSPRAAGETGPGFLLGKGAAAGERGAPLAPRLPVGGPGSGGEEGAEG